MQIPIMWRSEHEKIVTSIHRGDHTQREFMKKTYEDTAYKIREGLRRVLNKFTKINLSHLSDDYNTWRVIFDFDPRPIVFSLERGDDDFMIDMIAEELKQRLVKQLKALNVQRPEDLGLER